MTAAVFGLIGVVIGALITGGWNYALQVRAERREVRAVARLMLQELSGTAGSIRFALDRNIRGALEDEPSEREWKRHHLLLARHLSDDEWDAVALAYGESAILPLSLDDEHYPGQWQEDAKRIVGLVDAGCQVLRSRAHRAGWEQPDLMTW